MEKKTYTIPVVECISIDNEISLTLESNPPDGPDEVYLFQKSPYILNDDLV